MATKREMAKLKKMKLEEGKCRIVNLKKGKYVVCRDEGRTKVRHWE